MDTLLGLKPIDLDGVTPVANKAGISEVFSSFGVVANEDDGRVVRFPKNSSGKMIFVKNYVAAFDELFKSARRIYSEKLLEDVVGHANHTNLNLVHQYVNVFKKNGTEYYIRFTVREDKNGQEIEKNTVHSAVVSDVNVYKKETISPLPGNKTGSNDIANKGKTPFIDKKISLFLSPVNPDTVSKVVDENGEPLVVYHGSPNVFNVVRNPEDGSGMYFSPWKAFASEYGNTRSFFLNIKNPIKYDEVFEAINDIEEDEADGHIYLPQDIEGEIRQDRVGETEIIAFSPSQIKSATDNVGTFSQQSNDIRYEIDAENEDAAYYDVPFVEGIVRTVDFENQNEDRNPIFVSNTPEVFKQIGIPALPILMKKRKVRLTFFTKNEYEAAYNRQLSGDEHTHGLGISLAEVAKSFERPIAIIKDYGPSASKKSLIVVTEVSSNGKNISVPFVIGASLSPQNQYIDAHLAVTAYESDWVKKTRMQGASAI